MVADLNAGPMAVDQSVPLGGTALVGAQTGEIKPGFGALAFGLGGGDLGADGDQAAGEGKIEGLCLDSEGTEAAVFESSVAFGALGKKGEPGSTSHWRAWASKVG